MPVHGVSVIQFEIVFDTKPCQGRPIRYDTETLCDFTVGSSVSTIIAGDRTVRVCIALQSRQEVQFAMHRFDKQRLPGAPAIMERVDNGGLLGDQDFAFLDQVFRDARHIQPLVGKHPERQELSARAISPYKDITGKALEKNRNLRPGESLLN